jgi:hypothetical protein
MAEEALRRALCFPDAELQDGVKELSRVEMARLLQALAAAVGGGGEQSASAQQLPLPPPEPYLRAEARCMVYCTRGCGRPCNRRLKENASHPHTGHECRRCHNAGAY